MKCVPRIRKDVLLGFKRDHPHYVVVLKGHYPGTPSLEEKGIDLDKMGYIRVAHMKERFPQVVIWRSRHPWVQKWGNSDYLRRLQVILIFTALWRLIEKRCSIIGPMIISTMTDRL